MVTLRHLFKYGILSVISLAIPSKFSVFTLLRFTSAGILKIRIFRMLLDFSLPVTSSKSTCPPINILIPATQKDIGKLLGVLESLKTYSLNPIETVYICSPNKLSTHSFANLGLKVDLLTDDQVITSHIEGHISSSIPKPRQGWMRQQVIKLMIGINSELPLLVFDADTLLLRNTTFVFPDDKQLLQISHEFHSPYEKHFQEFLAKFNMPVHPANVSFVTHYQVFQSDLILKFLNSQNKETADKAIVSWIDLADFSQESPLSEYHCYGRYISTFYSERVRFESWRNFDRRDSQDLNCLLQLLIRFRSKSNHLVG